VTFKNSPLNVAAADQRLSHFFSISQALPA
jgi:hypothetical protein